VQGGLLNISSDGLRKVRDNRISDISSELAEGLPEVMVIISSGGQVEQKVAPTPRRQKQSTLPNEGMSFDCIAPLPHTQLVGSDR
jgi:hypothetical protein